MLTHCLQQLENHKRLLVGFSGGLDSTVLLHALKQIPTLSQRVVALHVNHGASSLDDQWQRHCEAWCAQEGIPLVIQQTKIHSNQEAVAREARYQAFDHQVNIEEALLLAHHADDQAETVLLQLSRGAGIHGLGAMQPVRMRGHYPIFRPFLVYSKQELRAYAKRHHIQWSEDDSNQKTHFRRNYLRVEVLPRLQERWPTIHQQLSALASHSQVASANLWDLACLDYPDLTKKGSPLSLEVLPSLKRERVANVLWFWLKQYHVTPLNTLTIERVLNELIYNPQSTGRQVKFAHQTVWSYRKCLYIETQPHLALQPEVWQNFPAPFVLPQQLGCLTVNQHSTEGLWIPPQAMIQVKFRQGGETIYWRNHHRSLKKCFQEWGVPPWKRGLIPLIYVNEELVQVMGYAMGSSLSAQTLESGSTLGYIIDWERGHAG